MNTPWLLERSCAPGMCVEDTPPMWRLWHIGAPTRHNTSGAKWETAFALCGTCGALVCSRVRSFYHLPLPGRWGNTYVSRFSSVNSFRRPAR